MGALFLAVDAGNTKTDAVIVDASGSLHGWGRAGSGDIYTGEAAAVAQVRLAVERAAGVPLESLVVEHAALRLAGCDWDDDEAFWRAQAQAWSLPASTSILNDGFAAIRLAAPDGHGLAVAAGTSSAVAARGPQGREFGLNMWGQHWLAALGLGRAGITAVALAELGMGPATALSAALPAHYGVDGPAGLVRAYNGRNPTITEREFSLAAPVVVTTAAGGDAVARAIIEEQAATFARYAVAIAAKAGYAATDSFPVAVNGSVARAPGSPFAAALLRHLAAALPAADLVLADVPPVCGAALDVLAEAGVALDDAVRAAVTGGMRSHAHSR